MRLRELVDKHSKEIDEKYKDVKCSFHGCELWSDCSTNCNGLKSDHVEGCKSFWYGWSQAIAEITGNTAPY